MTSAQIGSVDVSEDFFAFTDLMDARYKAHQAAPPKPCDCPRCTGPVATLLTMPCQGADWRQAEPEVRELWVGFRHEKRPGERGIRDALWAPMGPEYERWWQASGRGHTENHPIREEAIRLWREAVR